MLYYFSINRNEALKINELNVDYATEFLKTRITYY